MSRRKSGLRPSFPPRRTQGTVSIYLIAATAVFVLLNGMLIDLARILAFRKQAELAVKAGADSVLSSYDPSLYSRYGLFARGGDPADQLFRSTLEGHTEPQGGHAFHLLDVEWGTAEVAESRPLGTYDVFKRQVLEEMKYKAPVDLTLELASRFRGVESAVAEANTTVNALESMRRAYDKREAALDEAMRDQTKAGERLSGSWTGIVPNPPADLSGRRAAGVVHDAADAVMMYGDYTAIRVEAAARAVEQQRREEEKRKQAKEADMPSDSGTDESPHHSAQTAAYESGLRALASRLNTGPPSELSAVDAELSSAEEALAAAEEANGKMRQIADQAAASANASGKEPSAGVLTDAQVGEDESASLRELRDTASELVLDDSYFTGNKEELETQRTRGFRAVEEGKAFARLVSSEPGSDGMGEALRGGAERLQSVVAQYIAAYGRAGSVLQNRRKSVESHHSQDGKRTSIKKKADAAWSGAASFLGTLTGLRSSPEERKAFQKLDRLYRDNLSLNRTEEEAAAAVPVEKDPSVGRDAAMKASAGWFGALASSVAGGRDALYFAEYTAARFTHTEPSAVKSILNGGEGQLLPERQEAEYILYGLTNPAGNIAAAYAELFSFRLAVRTMEGLIECRSYGNPLLILAGALLYGVREALADLKQLLNKGTIPLSKYAKIDTNYLDYLRLFLLLHGDSAAQMSRRIAVIENETGLSLTEAYTYVSGEGTADLRLWFLPGLMKVLGRTANWGGAVRGNRYEAAYTADNAYQ